MDEATRTSGQAVNEGTREPAEIREDIAETREELGDTVEALAAKTDVKAQAKSKVEDVKAQAREKVEGVKQKVGGSKEPPAGGQAPGQPRSEQLRQGLDQAKLKANENPVQAAALGAFAGGVLVGLILGRR